VWQKFLKRILILLFQTFEDLPQEPFTTLVFCYLPLEGPVLICAGIEPLDASVLKLTLIKMRTEMIKY